MDKIIFRLFILLSAFPLLISCDDHEAVDTSFHAGYVLLDDHTCVDTASYESFYKPSGRKVVGVLFAPGNDDHRAMAVMLDEISMTYCDTVGGQGTSGSLTAYDGWSNTAAMGDINDNDSNYVWCPLAAVMAAWHTYGQSDFVPSVAEMRLLSSAARIINPIIEAYGGTPVDTEGDTWYWTSTEVDPDSGGEAWLCSAVNGGILPTPKKEVHKVRPVVFLDYPE